MRFLPFSTLCGVCVTLAAPVLAAPFHVSIPQPQTPMTEVLANLSKQENVTILTDHSVGSAVGPANFQAVNVGEMLTKLRSLEPGLTWRKVYLPADAPLPTGSILAQQVDALQAVSSPTLIVVSPTDRLTFSHGSNAAAPVPAGMQSVYLVVDDSASAKPQSSTPAAAAAPLPPAARADSGMQAVADVFSKMSASEQMQALPQMVQQFQRIMQNMDPRVRSSLGQFFQQGQGGPNGFGAAP